MHIDLILDPRKCLQYGDDTTMIAVIDVLRSTTSIIFALENGARLVMPAQSSEEALRISEHLPREQVVFCGERDNLPIPGFTHGVSPGEFTADLVKGKTIIMVMENGIATLVRSNPNVRLIVPSFVNLECAARYLSSRARDKNLVILCNGRNGCIALEDLYCTGMLVRAIEDHLETVNTGNDGVSIAKKLVTSYGDDVLSVLQKSEEGRILLDKNSPEDLRLSAQLSIIDILPVVRNGNLIAEV